MKNIKIALTLSFLVSSTALGTTLSEALISTYQSNPELIAARENLKTIDEKMYEAISGFLPSIGYSAQKTNTKRDTAQAPIFTQHGIDPEALAGQQVKVDPWIQSKSKQSSIKLQQNVFNGGKSIMAVQIAKYTIESGRASLLSTEQDIFLRTIQAYLNVIQNKQMLEINKENLTFYEQKLEAVRQEVEAQVKRRSDLAEAEAAKANAVTRLAKASGDYEDALATYTKMVGLSADNLTSSQSLTSIPANQVEFLQSSLKNNPDLLNVTYQQKAADINVISNAAAMLPSVDIGGSIDKSWSSTRGSNITQPYTNAKSVYVSVSVPIYQKGLEYSGVRKASAGAASLKYSVKNQKAVVTQGSTQAWSRYIVAQETVKSAEEAVRAGHIALEGLQQEYQEGVTTLTNMLIAQENLYQ